MKNTHLINEIDYLLETYCDGCFIRTHLRKEKGKTVAHNFCIRQCTIGEEIKQAGTKLQGTK
ncbi:zinc-finger domain-containing protein [Psychrobacillus sp. FSL H8-0484]|uniref:zinc-finger domain-containing protein n=1 Tax=Psychrobacillus sp. FSL H8-0484 TaxID=2921390 RepID=UPI0030F57B8A